jgi:NADH:ubiquinone oxidoreductase subunit E
MLVDVADEVDNVATFFNDFPPSVGREVILICNSATCWIVGTVLLER